VEQFPHKLIELRRQAGLSQEKLAHAAGVSLGAVFRWENGDRGPTLANACKLAEVLKVDLNTLVGKREVASCP
jgi:transcriptional regulator with XRE-family HTH domain